MHSSLLTLQGCLYHNCNTCTYTDCTHIPYRTCAHVLIYIIAATSGTQCFVVHFLIMREESKVLYGVHGYVKSLCPSLFFLSFSSAQVVQRCILSRLDHVECPYRAVLMRAKSKYACKVQRLHMSSSIFDNFWRDSAIYALLYQSRTIKVSQLQNFYTFSHCFSDQTQYLGPWYILTYNNYCTCVCIF